MRPDDLNRTSSALLESEERFRLLVESITDYAIFMLDPSGHIVSWNKGAARIKGYSADEVLGRHFSLFFTPEDREEGTPERELEAAVREGHSEYEGWRVRKDGSRFWANAILTALRDRSGRLYGLVKVTRDMTERRQADEELRQSEQRLRLMIESVRDYAIFMLDPDGRVRSWNPGAQKIKGYQPDEIIGKHFSIFFPPEDAAAGVPWRLLETAAREGRVQDERWRVTRSGTRFWGSVVISAMRDPKGELTGFVKVTRDMTERKLAEEQRQRLLQEEAAHQATEAALQRLAFLADAGDALSSSLNLDVVLTALARLCVERVADWCAVYVVDDDGQTRQWTAHRGRDGSGVLTSIVHLPPATRSSEYGPRRVMDTGRPEIYAELAQDMLTALAADDRQLATLRDLGIHSALAAPLRRRAEVLGAIVLGTCARGKAYGDGDLVLAQNLAGRIVLAVENSRLYQQAQEAIRVREEFLSVASHELRTPVTALKLQIQRLQRQKEKGRFAGADAATLGEGLERADRQIKQLVTLAEALLDITRIDAGTANLRLTEFDLAALAREVADSLAATLLASGSVLTIQAPEPVLGAWDRTRLHQVLANLLSNAIKYGAGNPIEISVARQDDRAVLIVRDRGIGIPPDQTARIFDRFARAVTPEHYSGLGLGLYVVKQIVEAHGGTIQATSTPQAGTAFRVHLPLNAQPAP